MAFNAFVVYVTDERQIRYLRQTQALALADSAADAALTAHMGVVAVPDAARPGWFFNPDLTITPDAALSLIDQLKGKARGTHQQMGAWTLGLNAAALTHSSAHVNYGHDLLFRGHQGMWIVLQRHPGAVHVPADRLRTIPERIVYCEQMALGAADVATVPQFFEHVHTVADVPGNEIDAPVTWVDPDDNTRKNFAMVPNSHDEFTTAELADAAIPGPDVLRDGDWIEDLVA